MIDVKWKIVYNGATKTVQKERRGSDMYSGSAQSVANAGLNGIAYVIALALSMVVMMLGMRWFVFVKAGQKGWKALIPFYSDYINYKIAWDGRIYVALLVGSIASALLGAICGLIHPVFGMVISVICNTAVLGAGALAGMILQFKMARAFGRNDYFAVGLYFVSPVFTAILAFGDAHYQGAPTDGIGVPDFVSRAGERATAAASAAANAAAQQLQHQVEQQAQTAPAQPQAYQQPYQQQSYQQPAYQNYQPPMQQGYAQPQQGYPQPPQGYAQHPQRSRRAARSPETMGE